MKDLRVELRFKNAVLYNALQDRFEGLAKMVNGRRLGFLAVAAKTMNVNYQDLISLVGLRKSPRSTCRRKHEWTKTAIAIAEYLGEPIEALFPLDLYGLDTSAIAFDVESSRLLTLRAAAKELVASSPDELMTPLSEVFDGALQRLAPHEEEVLRLRYGLDGEVHTLGSIAEKFSLSVERIRQIENHAMRKLRHPRFKELREHANAIFGHEPPIHWRCFA